jgi:hypothetical protein
MNRIYNVDTGHGKIRFSYRIMLIVDNSSPITRMVETLKANGEINNWVSKHRSRWNFPYKIDDNMLYVDTLQIVDRFKETFDGKESKHYIIKSMRSKNSNKRKKNKGVDK